MRKTIISFIEEAWLVWKIYFSLSNKYFLFSQHDPEVIVKVIDSLRLLLYDDNVLVQKKLIVSMITIYRLTLKVRISITKIVLICNILFSGFQNLDLLMKMFVVCGKVWLIWKFILLLCLIRIMMGKMIIKINNLI